MLSQNGTVFSCHLPKKQTASLAPSSTKALQSTSIERPPLYKVKLELDNRHAVVLDRYYDSIFATYVHHADRS